MTTNLRVRTVPRLCELNPGICLTTEEKARKNLSQGSNVPPLPADLDELTNRITAAVKSVTEDALRRVWDEFSYRVDVVGAAGGGHIEHL